MIGRAARLTAQLGGVGLLLNVITVLALVVSVTGASTGAVVALWVAAALILVLARWRTAGQSWRTSHGLGDFVVARLSVAVSALALAWRSSADSALRAATICLVLVALCEPVLRRLLSSSHPVTAHLPGVDDARDPSFGYGKVYLVGLVGLVVLCLAATTTAPSVPALGLAAAAAVGLLLASAQTARNVLRRRRSVGTLAEAVSAFAPAFALHWQAAAGTSYQVGMWLPYLERLGLPFVVVVRSAVNLAEAAALTSAPVIQRGGAEDLDDVVAPSLRAVFYVNNSPRNTHMVRYPGLTHIQLNHGDSDKAPSFNPVFRMYDKDFVAGQAAIDRFAANGVHVSDDLFTIVGRPQVEDVQIADVPIADGPEPASGRRTVLYAPTWAGFNDDSMYCSLGVGVELVRALLDRGCDVVFRPHPYARRTPAFRVACDAVVRLLADDRTPGAAHVFGPKAETAMSVVDCFNRSDAMISDVSSVVADYLYSEKPLAMVAVSTDAATFPDEFPLARAAYVIDAHDGTMHGLDAVLDDLLGPDPMREARRSLKTYYLGDIPAESYAQRFLDEAGRYV